MSSLFRPKVVVYTLNGKHRTPDGKRVTSKTPGAVRKVAKSKKWYGRYTDASGAVIRKPLSTCKETSRRMLAKLAGDVELARVGIVDPFSDHRKRPLAEHLEDFRRYLVAKGNVAEHVQKTIAQCSAVLSGCKFGVIDDIQPSAVVEFIAGLAAAETPEVDPAQEFYTPAEVAALLGIRGDSVGRMVRRGYLRCELVPSPTKKKPDRKEKKIRREEVLAMLEKRRGPGIETRNHYLASIKHFSKWLVKDRRTNVDALIHLSRQNADTDQRHPRRVLREEVFVRLVETTAKGTAFRGITGPDRLVIYTLAANTGFRASELGSLSPASFDFETTPPTVTVEAGYSKHRRKDVQPIRTDVADMMRQYVAGRPRGELLWPGGWTECAAEMVRVDLEAAGIPYCENGRFFDFHAMRAQFISTMAAKGVHPKVAQVLARHSTITLTMDFYTHLDVFDVTGALDVLPAVKAQPAGESPQQKTA